MNNNVNTGVMFPNNKTNEKQPDFKGSANVDGVDFSIAMWNRVSKSGNNYFSMVFEKAQEKNVQNGRKEPDFKKNDIVADEIPW